MRLRGVQETVGRRPTTAVVLVALVPVLGLAVGVYAQQRGVLEGRAVDLLESTAEAQRDRIAVLVDEAREEHVFVAGRAGAAGPLDAGPSADLTSVLQQAVDADPDIVGATLLATTDSVLAAVGESAPRPVAGGTPGSPAMTFTTTAEGALRQTVTGPAGGEGSPAATLVLVRDPSALLDALADRSGLGATGETLLAFRDVDGTARFVAPPRFASGAPLEDVRGSRADSLPISRALAGDETVLTHLEDYRGEPVFAAIRALPEAGWGLVTKIDRAEVLAPAADLARVLAVGAAVTLLASATVALLLSGALRSSRRALHRSRHQLSQVLGTAPVGITFMDPSGRITYANDRAEDLLGLTRSHLAPRAYQDADSTITDLDDRPLPEDELPLARVLASHEPVRDLRQVIHTADGERRALAVDAAPLIDGGTVTGVVTTYRDITEELATAEARARLAAIVASTDDAVISLDHTGLVTTWNRGAERLFGHPAEQMVGSHIERIVPSERRAELGQLHARVHAGQVVAGVETVRVRQDGTHVPISLTLSPIRDERGEIVGLSAIDRDITEEVRARQQLETYAAELEQFAHVVAHDLQEPLRMIASFPELLARRYGGRLGEDADEFIGFSVDGARRLRAKLNDLLAYVSVTTDTPLAVVDTDRLVHAALTSLRAELHQAGGEVVVGAMPRVLGDETQLLRVFRNLLGNAVKFHGERPLRVHVDAKRTNGLWEFAVRDNGIGIPSEYLDRLFLLFRRLHTQLEYPGSGLGLAICKKVVERHGGQVWITSEVDVGTTVHFTLLAATDEPTDKEHTHA